MNHTMQESLNHIFTTYKDWGNNAILMHHSLSYSKAPLGAYIVAYSETINILFDRIFERKDPIDYFVYPLLFLCRHYFEIQFKYILQLDDIDYDKKHGLKVLWDNTKDIVLNRWPANPPPEFENIEEIINAFSTIDPNSTAFRYAETKSNKTQLQDQKHINLRALHEKISPAISFLEGVTLGMEEQNQQ